jgi:phage terminase large subunit-like protein
METETYRFDIIEIGGQTSKPDRIKRLLPIFENGRLYLPESLHITDWQKTTVDLVHSFVEEEYMAFPVGMHDDMMDALARIAEPDLKLVWPKEEVNNGTPPPRINCSPNVAWMA